MNQKDLTDKVFASGNFFFRINLKHEPVVSKYANLAMSCSGGPVSRAKGQLPEPV